MNDPSPLFNDPARAWAPYEPTSDDPWDLARVAHLHRRAGFAAPWATLERDRNDGPAASVDRLLEGEPNAGDGQPAGEFAAMLDRMSAQLAPSATLTRIQSIWLYRMIFTPHPLLERMTLFWHNHFATSNAKVNNPALMERQNHLLRSHALGDFKAMLAQIGKDPAMLIWLDSTENRKGHPNENYAREVMELFTLGRGRYTEKDIQEAARAFTGWFVVQNRFTEIPGQHDPGPKTVLGKSGALGGDDIPPILLGQGACAEFLCTKLARHFVSEVDTFPPELIDALAAQFRDSGYDIKAIVKVILRSNLFHSVAVRRRRVKSPVEFTVGTIRALEVLKPTVQADALAEACGRMGQHLYAPPSVAGWDGGPAWANSTTMLNRTNFALALLSGEAGPFGRRCDVARITAAHGKKNPKEAAALLVELLVQDALGRDVRDRVSARTDLKDVATLILTSPEYQLG